MTSEEEGATRLGWSSDDDGDFFSEDEKQSDDGWDDGFGDNDELGVSPDKNEANDSNMDVTDEEEIVHENKGAVDASSLLVATPGPSKSAPLPNHNAFGRPPKPDSKSSQYKQQNVFKNNVGSSLGSSIFSTPSNLSTGSTSVDGGIGLVPASPLSNVGTTTTSVVELGDEDQDFEAILRKRNRDRKEREDYNIAHMKVQMVRLEEALAAETKRRVDATTALDELARSQVHEMEERVRGQLREEDERLQSRLTQLEERVRKLEEKWVTDTQIQIEAVNSKAADLNKSISQIRDDQDMDRKARLKRERILLQQVEAHTKETEERWTSERNERIKRMKELEDQVIRNEARLALEQKRYEDRIEKELVLLKEELEAETIERQTQDEEIVAALNRYTKQLQHSLSILSSD